MFTFDFLQSLAYTKTVSKPVSKNAHQDQFPETPFTRTTFVTKFGVSVEKVVATIDKPNNHQGIVRPERKYSVEFFPDFLETYIPINKVIEKNKTISEMSKVDSLTINIRKRIIFKLML